MRKLIITSRASGTLGRNDMKKVAPPAVRPVSMARPNTAAAAAAFVADKPTTCCRNSGAESKCKIQSLSPW